MRWTPGEKANRKTADPKPGCRTEGTARTHQVPWEKGMIPWGGIRHGVEGRLLGGGLEV